MTSDNKSHIKEGFLLGIPLVLGYFPIAMAFGLMSKNTGLSFTETWFSSLFVYAGASQFMFLDLIRADVSAGGIILATFLLNLRHLMMSASVSVNLKKSCEKYLPLIGFGITDESFSVLSFNKEKLHLPFVLVIISMAYLAWVAGTIMGYLVGEIIPPTLQTSLSLGLYALFAALLFPSFKVSNKFLILSIISGIIYASIYYMGILTAGWDIIVAILIGSMVGVIIFGKEEDLDE